MVKAEASQLHGIEMSSKVPKLISSQQMATRLVQETRQYMVQCQYQSHRDSLRVRVSSTTNAVSQQHSKANFKTILTRVGFDRKGRRGRLNRHKDESMLV